MTVFDGLKFGVGFSIGMAIVKFITDKVTVAIVKETDEDQEQNDAESTEVG